MRRESGVWWSGAKEGRSPSLQRGGMHLELFFVVGLDVREAVVCLWCPVWHRERIRSPLWALQGG